MVSKLITGQHGKTTSVDEIDRLIPDNFSTQILSHDFFVNQMKLQKCQ